MGIGAPAGADFLIGYNGGGVGAGDGDFNEPPFLVHIAADPSTVPEPSLALLVAAAFASLRLARPHRAA